MEPAWLAGGSAGDKTREPVGLDLLDARLAGASGVATVGVAGGVISIGGRGS